MWIICMMITSPWTSDRVWPAGSSLRTGESSVFTIKKMKKCKTVTELTSTELQRKKNYFARSETGALVWK